MGKVIFLDIDGVLNSNFWNADHQMEISDGKYIDNEKVKLLSGLVKKSGASIILHSGWRFWFGKDLRPLRKEAGYLADLLEKEGMSIAGMTPDLTTEEIRKTKKFSKVKADEILMWLKDHPDTERWVVLDDLELHNDEIRKYQVMTDPEHGLTEKDVENTLGILGGNMAKQNIYDTDIFFDSFKGIRSDEINFNDLIETPIITAMLPDLKGKRVLDIGCGMGQHAMQYAKMGACSVMGIDISEKMLSFAKEHNSSEIIEYKRLAFEELDTLKEKYDVITSSLAFDYVEDFGKLMKDIYNRLDESGFCVFSMSHPISTAWDGVYDRYTRTENGERLYANLHNYGIEGIRRVHWVVDDYELYHRTVSTLINSIVSAGLTIEECQESKISAELMNKYPDKFGGILHHPDFIFFRCRK